MTSREQFEAWWKTQRAVCQFAREGSKNGAYHSKPCQSAWDAWQASRKAVEVELPTAEGEEGGITELIVALCSEAIRSAGIKVKGE